LLQCQHELFKGPRVLALFPKLFGVDLAVKHLIFKVDGSVGPGVLFAGIRRLSEQCGQAAEISLDEGFRFLANSDSINDQQIFIISHGETISRSS
jgi:hypothetical protein